MRNIGGTFSMFHSRCTPGGEGGTNGTHPYRGVPVFRPLLKHSLTTPANPAARSWQTDGCLVSYLHEAGQ
ncbi:hypothetical protein C8D95_104241 [Silicimonas algicola]|uniref:Uncharacterized protein n=1 Tax=Silicimonas algicola TaxID=1826607 RepID=A0A316G6Y1_9RHOB|nr:hypothetical protein C8D95_104241 [Silicimonas algicola]